MSSKVYTIAFRTGVLFNVLLFTLLNVMSFGEANKDAEEIIFDTGAAPWGFPFDWQSKLVVEGGGMILNVLIAAAGGFFFGFLFKFVWSKISLYRTELK